jgi:hypothetical protein
MVSMVPPRDYISSTEQRESERESENGARLRLSRKKRSAED